MGFRRLISLGLVAMIVALVPAGARPSPVPSSPTCAGLRALFREDLLVCSDSTASRSSAAAFEFPVRPLVAGIRINASVPKYIEENLPKLIGLYGYNTGTKAKAATQDWVTIFPQQLLPDYSEANSANGCNGEVCIFVKGEGRVVDEWWTTAWQEYGEGFLCPDVYWTIDYDPNTAYPHHHDTYINYNGPCAMAPQPGDRVLWYGHTEHVPFRFADQSILCNRWREDGEPFAGFPCIRIHT